MNMRKRRTKIESRMNLRRHLHRGHINGQCLAIRQKADRRGQFLEATVVRAKVLAAFSSREHRRCRQGPCLRVGRDRLRSLLIRESTGRNSQRELWIGPRLTV